jgi:hypothetical protein
MFELRVQHHLINYYFGVKVARFGFPPSAGPENGQAAAPFKQCVS